MHHPSTLEVLRKIMRLKYDYNTVLTRSTFVKIHVSTCNTACSVKHGGVHLSHRDIEIVQN